MSLGETVPQTYAKAIYHFSSGAETTDSSGNSRTLSAISDPAYIAGKFGNAVELDVNDAYSMTDHADFKPTGNFTLSAWINKAAASDGVIMANYTDSAAKECGISLSVRPSTGYARLTSARNTGASLGTDYQVCTGAINVCSSTWRFIVGTWDGSNLKVYTDGRLETSVAWANAPGYPATGYPRIGCIYYGAANSYFLDGKVDEVVFWNGIALSDQTIRRMYALGNGKLS